MCPKCFFYPTYRLFNALIIIIFIIEIARKIWFHLQEIVELYAFKLFIRTPMGIRHTFNDSVCLATELPPELEERIWNYICDFRYTPHSSETSIETEATRIIDYLLL